MHKVVVDRSHAMVCMTADGFFTVADIERAADDLHAAIRSLGPRVGAHVTLYDLSNLSVASADVLSRFATYFTAPHMAPLWARRVAFVVRSGLVAGQLQRIGNLRDHLRVFEDRREATAWLLADHDRLRDTSHPTRASG